MTPRTKRTLKWIVILAVLLLAARPAYYYARRATGKGPTPEMSAGTQRLVRNVQVSPEPPEPSGSPNTQRERLLVEAWKLKGIPYKFGAKGPDRLDCSGFTKLAYEAIGVRLPDGSFNQALGEAALNDLGQLKPGDLLFYRWAHMKGVSHVAMYAGEGWVIGTGSPGQAREVVVYRITDDLVPDGRVITYRHIELKDEE